MITLIFVNEDNVFQYKGVGSRITKKEIIGFIRKHNVDTACIQESKLEVVNDIICNQLWGADNFAWAAKTINWPIRWYNFVMEFK